MHIAGIPTDLQKMASEIQAIKVAQMQSASQQPAVSEDSLEAQLKDPARIQKGHEVFAAKCTPCHGANAEGTVGPNLTDEYWIHGGSALQVKKTIEEGVVAKGMLAWKGLLPAEEIDAILSYLWSIKNTNHPGKAPEGQKG